MRIISPSMARNLEKMVDFYSQFNPSSLSIKQFMDFGLKANEQKSYQFLKKELPVRLANIMKEIHLLPDNLLKMPSVNLVNNWYAQSFKDVLEFEIDDGLTESTLSKFTQALVKIRNRHSDVVQTMAQGVLELKESHKIDTHTENSIQYFLDRFYMSRIGIRMLINQHTLLFGEHLKNNQYQHIGCIDPNCNVMNVVKDAYENARFLCDQYYLTSPELQINQPLDRCDEEPIRIVYVPSHLYHILFEIFKNAMRAIVEHHKIDVLPPLIVTLVKGKEDICVKSNFNKLEFYKLNVQTRYKITPCLNTTQGESSVHGRKIRK
ncbi:pyruvate dehydrogenase (acetyl-transferring) kinase, mitochondrial isoform X2 [Adelges cooleyi]|uniref:pyruvate dehydrogenase (acetyl-transferring) kinase, mitochondrial isoform X2 n=1 Tax=Adelges cooleyi TaxID=133065 RepID=UPI00217F3970|nr:pyruvate dehydrogenase (acetyl-transferring) kinase, mitochondrial isoform X2 [Adelges cooleyi]